LEKGEGVCSEKDSDKFWSKEKDKVWSKEKEYVQRKIVINSGVRKRIRFGVREGLDLK